MIFLNSSFIYASYDFCMVTNMSPEFYNTYKIDFCTPLHSHTWKQQAGYFNE